VEVLNRCAKISNSDDYIITRPQIHGGAVNNRLVILGYIGRLWKPPPESRSTPTVLLQVLSTLLAWNIPNLS
jgi:hypothetical protein